VFVALDDGDAGSGQGVEAEVAAAFDPVVVLFGEDGTDEADQGVAVGKDADDVGAAPDLVQQPDGYLESVNARYRRAVRARGHFPTEQAALKCLYLATRALDPTGKGKARWAMRWKPALNAFAITFEGRITPNGN